MKLQENETGKLTYANHQPHYGTGSPHSSNRTTNHLSMNNANRNIITKIAQDDYHIVFCTPKPFYDNLGEPDILKVALTAVYKINMAAALEHLAKRGIMTSYEDLSPASRASCMKVANKDTERELLLMKQKGHQASVKDFTKVSL